MTSVYIIMGYSIIIITLIIYDQHTQVKSLYLGQMLTKSDQHICQLANF